MRPRVLLRVRPSGVLLGRPARRVPFTDAMPCRRGQDWLTLSRRAAEALHRAAVERPDRLAHYRRTVLPTESFPHTVLWAEPGMRFSGDSRRLVRFAPGSANPATLTTGDFDAIVASGTDFARKFDATVDAEVLDRLDSHLRS
jgi:hypothetical protein